MSFLDDVVTVAPVVAHAAEAVGAKVVKGANALRGLRRAKLLAALEEAREARLALRELGLNEFLGNFKLGLPPGPQRNAALKKIGALKNDFLNHPTKPGKIIWKRGDAPVDAAGNRVFGKYNSVDNTIELYKDADLSTLTHELLHFDQARTANRVGQNLITHPAQRQTLERDVLLKLQQMGFVPR